MDEPEVESTPTEKPTIPTLTIPPPPPSTSSSTSSPSSTPRSPTSPHEPLLTPSSSTSSLSSVSSFSSVSSSQPPIDLTKIDHNSPYYRDYLLLMEFKHLPEKIAGGGIYAMPSFDTLYVWHCAIFIRQGVYRSAVFRFTLTIPSNYPNAPPEVRFITPIYHPLIGTDGSFDISHEFPDWTSRRHFLFKVLAYVKKVFYHLDLCTSRPALNKEAQALYTSDQPAFLAKAEECSRNSTSQVFDNPDGYSIKFSPYTKEMESMRENILKGKLDKGNDNSLLSWVSKGVSSLISFKY